MGDMGQTLATSSSDVEIKCSESASERPSLDSGDAVRLGASQEVELLALHTTTYSRTDITDASRPTLAKSLPLVPSTARDPEQDGRNAVADPDAVFESVRPPPFDELRALLSHSWSPATAYPDTVDQPHWMTGDPRGQCGVSSVWLSEVLSRVYSINSTFCRGSVRFNDQDVENLSDHCWLEIDEKSGDQLILDLTCDQAAGLRQIVFESKADLAKDHIQFISDQRLNISDLAPDNAVWPRYQSLLFNMVMITAFGASLPLDKSL
jgi:hypothetical protein